MSIDALEFLPKVSAEPAKRPACRRTSLPSPDDLSDDVLLALWISVAKELERTDTALILEVWPARPRYYALETSVRRHGAPRFTTVDILDLSKLEPLGPIEEKRIELAGGRSVYARLWGTVDEEASWSDSSESIFEIESSEELFGWSGIRARRARL